MGRASQGCPQPHALAWGLACKQWNGPKLTHGASVQLLALLLISGVLRFRLQRIELAAIVIAYFTLGSVAVFAFRKGPGYLSHVGGARG